MILGPREMLGVEKRSIWAAARVWAAHQVPYMASALLALEPVVVDQSEDPPEHRLDLSALPVDERWHVYLDVDVLGTMDVPTVGFWLVHQVSHLLRDHAQRSPVRDPERALGPGRTPDERTAELEPGHRRRDQRRPGGGRCRQAGGGRHAKCLGSARRSDGRGVLGCTGRARTRGRGARAERTHRGMRLWQRL